MIKKLAMLATVTAGLFMGANTAGSIPQASKAPLDTGIIVELERSLSSLTDEGIRNVQNAFLNRVRSEVTSNVKVLSNYTVLNNAVAIAVNSQYVSQITNLSGVKSVTRNELHEITSTSRDIIPVDPETDYGGSDNISADTMKKPDNTNDGEGTVIAIIDNEFYLRGKHTEKNEAGEDVTIDAWHHETFTSFEELSESVTQRFQPKRKVIQGKTIYITPDLYQQASHAKSSIVANTEVGTEGSLFFNSKVPFYYDYGGSADKYGVDGTPDCDVTSLIDYHGSHVASIAAGHSEFYKGIAPKAQLVLMKVSTDFRAPVIAEQMGLSSYSGMFDTAILNALEDAISLGVDGINMSLGTNLDDFDGDSITMKTITRLSDAGILSAISAGNAGKTSFASLGGYGNWTSDMVETGTLGGYANHKSATIIASAQPNKIFYTQALKIGSSFVAFEDQVTNREGFPKDYKVERPFKDLFPTGTESLAWQYVPGFGTAADYVGIDVRGKLAIVNRGSTAFSDKYTVAKNQGAKAMVIINNDPTANDFNFHCSFGETQPEFPIILVLFKDKQVFDGTLGEKSGVLHLAQNELQVNEKAKTASTFTSDGLSFDLEIKPDISSPGDLIRGAVPPQNKDDKDSRPLTSYAFLSGTSMASPNYAGAQSVLLSKQAKAYYSKAAGAMTADQFAAYKNTIDMRMLSTADPMYDLEVSPETGVKTLTSPRIQGAGLVDLGGAYNTDVYLEGADVLGNHTGKAKVSLRNYEDINNGRIKLKFYSHNESDENRSYDAYLTVMRPAIKNDNGVVTKDYNYRGEIDSITAWPSRSYWELSADPETGADIYVERTVAGKVENKDYFKVSREITYYATEEACRNATYDEQNHTWSCSNCGELHIAGGEEHCPNCLHDKEHYTEDFYTRIAPEKYVYNEETRSWEVLPGYDYQSTQDVFIEERLPLGELTFVPGEELHELATYQLSNEVKEDILKFFEYGCYIEGFLTLESRQNKENLNLVYAGFFAGGENTYHDAPVVEPFNFEKDEKKVYPSDLVNDIAKVLAGKDVADFGSTWIAGYLESGKSFDTTAYEENTNSFSNLAKTSSNWHFVGEDPFTGEMVDNPKDNIYVGDPRATNTMIIQQFVMRSVVDNYFTIVNTETGEQVYKSNLQDIARPYGYMKRWPLYKSHVNGDRLGSYIADKAVAIIPLYDVETGVAFEDGEYAITFNYLLAGTNEWTGDKYQYKFTIDSSAPEVSKVVHDSVDESVRLYIEEGNLAYAAFGGMSGGLWEVQEDEDGQYVEVSEEKLTELLDENPNEATDDTGRLYLSLVNKAFGSTGVVVRFRYDFKKDAYDFDNQIMAQHNQLTIAHDLIDRGTYLSIIEVNGGQYKEVTDEDIVKFALCSRNNVVIEHVEYVPVVTGGCGGNVAATSIILSTLSISAIVLIVIARKKKKLGGK